jgi:hypothetical protein
MQRVASHVFRPIINRSAHLSTLTMRNSAPSSSSGSFSLFSMNFQPVFSISKETAFWKNFSHPAPSLYASIVDSFEGLWLSSTLKKRKMYVLKAWHGDFFFRIFQYL